MHANISVRACGGGGGELYVCEYCMHVKKKEAVGMNQELHMWKHFEQKQFP